MDDGAKSEHEVNPTSEWFTAAMIIAAHGQFVENGENFV